MNDVTYKYHYNDYHKYHHSYHYNDTYKYYYDYHHDDHHNVKNGDKIITFAESTEKRKHPENGCFFYVRKGGSEWKTR